MEKSYPLTQAQLYIFNECIEEPRLANYNIVSKMTLSARIDKDRVVKSLQEIIAARPVLRNRFFLDANGNPRQYEDKEMEIPIHDYQMSEEELESYTLHQFMRPFSLLSGEPLCRFALVETEKHRYLLSGMHHTISDGTTLCLLYHKYDLPMAYAGKPLKREMMTLYDYALEEEKLMGSEAYKEAAEYYKNKFAGLKPTELSAVKGSPLGNAIKCDVRMDKADVEAWCKQHHMLPNTLIQAVFSLMLSRISGQQKVVYISGRHGRVLRPLFSSYGLYFTNVPVLIDVDPDQNVLDFLHQVAEEWQSTLKISQYSFVQFCKDTQCSPNIFCSYQGNTVERYCFLDDEILPVEEVICGATQDDIECMFYIADDQFEIHLQTSDARYDEPYILHFAHTMKACIHSLMRHEDGKLRDIELLW